MIAPVFHWRAKWGWKQSGTLGACEWRTEDRKRKSKTCQMADTWCTALISDQKHMFFCLVINYGNKLMTLSHCWLLVSHRKVYLLFLLIPRWNSPRIRISFGKCGSVTGTPITFGMFYNSRESGISSVYTGAQLPSGPRARNSLTTLHVHSEIVLWEVTSDFFILVLCCLSKKEMEGRLRLLEGLIVMTSCFQFFSVSIISLLIFFSLVLYMFHV